MNVVPLVTRDNSGMLESLEDLRAKIEAGEVIAFIAVGIQGDDATLAWSGAVEGVTRLRMMGAIANLEHCYHAGDVA